ncbi:hypothetical protein DUI87_19221 [Hirundo rustica rustica]|uniref:ribonuclease H n=2 Tax=Hirundo rustica rustica TaxID=333673 RepID=A0A3M0JZQ1_HIRRU|nr:hypothetical protein DUI87_19221 [Hirundo rustica rustica]
MSAPALGLPNVSEQDNIKIVVTNIVNPASFPSGSIGEPVIHDCLETIEATYSSRQDLKDIPLEGAETWFTDGSSYVISGRRHAGGNRVWTINIYMDSRYAFGVVHAHGAIWKERGLLNSQGKSIKHAQEILRLLDAIQLPERVAIMHIKAHHKVSSELEEGNMLADREAKEAAKGEVPDKAVEAALIPDGKVSIEGKPMYNKKDKKLIKDGQKPFLPGQLRPESKDGVLSLDASPQTPGPSIKHRINDFGCLCFLRIGQQFSGDPDGTPKVAGAVHVLIHSTPAPSDSRESSVRARPLRLADDHERDLLSLLNVKIIFEHGRVKLEVPGEEIAKLFVIKEIDPSPIPIEVDQAVVPWVWETGSPGKSKAAQPVVVELKEGKEPVKIKQYPITLEARKGVAPLITQFLTQGILQECESEFNTPIFPVKKPNGKYRLVQDLRAINKIVKDIHPVVANPYTLLTSVSEKFKWFSVVDLKDAFFCIPLALESRKYFAFEWESPDTGRKRQLTWSRLPQGFKNSPTIFGNQLAKELEEWKTTEVRESPLSYVILQYVDDIFLATEEKETCLKLTIALLNMLGQAGYRVSKEKAQLLKESVIYLGCEITQGQRRLGVNRVEAICAIPLPRNHQELRSFLGMVGWCRLWILNFGLIAKPLYEALKEPRLNWDRQRKKAFEDLKQALKEAPALGLPDLNKDFQLYVNERQKLALGVLAQRLGSWKRPVGYFSKQLDAVSAGWPSCLRAVTATVILIQEARKLTLGRKIEVFVPHMVLAVLEQKGGHWLSSSRMLQYQAILREQDDVDLKMTNHINPAEFLRSEQEEGELAHDCIEVIEQVYASRIDLKDVPMENPDWELFTDGSSFVESGTRYAGYAVVTATTVVEAKALTPGTSAQRAEIIGLTRALMLSSGKKVNIWTDSKYAFGVVHIHGALWKERGLLNSQGTAIKYRTEILALLDAVHQPEKVAVMHVRGHQKEEGKIYQGNRLADITARRASKEVWTQMALIPTKVSPVTPHLIQEPKYSPDDEKLASLLLAQKNATGWYVTSMGQVVVPTRIMKTILETEHNKCHWGAEALVKFLKREVISNQMLTLAKRVNAMCPTCLKNNPIVRKQIQLGKLQVGPEPGDYWQVDFSELPKAQNYKYLLVRPSICEELVHTSLEGNMGRAPASDPNNLYGSKGRRNRLMDPLHSSQESPCTMGNPAGLPNADDFSQKVAFLIILLLEITKPILINGSVVVAATEPVVDVINGIDVNLTCFVANDQKTEVQNIQATWKKGANIVTVWDKDARRAKVQRRRVTRQVMEGTGQPEIETDLDRKGHENLVVGLIRDFGMVQNVSRITACLPLPKAAGEPIPWGIVPVGQLPNATVNVTWNCKVETKEKGEWVTVCAILSSSRVSKEQCEQMPDALKHLNVLPKLRGPEVDTILKVWPDQCRVQGKNDLPAPAGHTIPDTGQDAIGLLGHQGTLLAHVQSVVDHYPQVPFHLSTVQSHRPQPIKVQDVIVAKMQDSALGLIKLHLIGLCPSIQPFKVSLQSPPTFQQIDTRSQLTVIHKFTNERLNTLIHVINKNIEQNWPQHRSLRNTTSDWPPAGCSSVHHHSPGPAIQPVPNPAKSAPVQAMG